MNRPYQFYYFVPLVSFWFVFIYVTMTVWPRITTTSVDSKSSWRVSLTECQGKARHAPVMSDEVLALLSVCSKLQVICIWSSWWHCHPIISCFIKIQNGLTVLVPTYGGCRRNRSLNSCPSDCLLCPGTYCTRAGCSSPCQGPLSLYVDVLQSLWPSVMTDLRLPSEQENTATVPVPYTHFP